jgi:hypothetical protein
VRWLGERGIEAAALASEFEGEHDDGAVAEAI